MAHYRILERIGSGALGTVYRAQDTRTGREVALKVFWAYFSQEPELVERFFHEIQLVAAMDHVHILRIHDFGQDQRRVYVATDFIDGGSLKQQHDTPVAVRLAVDIAWQVAEALDYAHEHGVFHRNIKPSNVLMDSKGRCYLADFGTATLGEGSHPMMRVAMSSPMPEFMSPEQAEGRPLDRRSDVYSLSVLVYNLLTDDVPYPAYTPMSAFAKQTAYSAPTARSLNPDVPEAVDLVLARGLSFRREERYPTAGEMAHDLLRASTASAAQTEQLGRELDVARAAGGGVVEAAARPMELSRTRARGAPIEPHGDMEALPQEGWLICPVCGHSNLTNTLYCVNCWARLRHVASVSDAEEEIHAARLRRQRLVSRITRVAVTTVLAIVAVGLGVWQYQERTREVLVPTASTRVSSASVAGEWTMRGLNPARTSYEDRVAPEVGGNLKWTFATKEPISSSPAVADGKVFVGTGDWRVVALDTASGEIVWQYRTTGPVDSSPAVAAGLVYVGLFDGNVLAINAETGQLEWSYLTGDPIYGSPMVYDGVLYIASGDARLYALDAVTGEFLWSYETDAWIASSPAISDGVVVVSTHGGRIYLLTAKSGQLRFYYETIMRGGVRPPINSSPAMAGSVVYVGGEDEKVHAIRGDDYWRWGETDLRLPWTQFFRLGMAPVTPRPTGWLWSFNARSIVFSSPAVGGGKVFVGVQSGRFLALDAETGKKVWDFNTESRINSSPVVVGGVVYFGADNGVLYALNAETGEPVFTFKTGGKIVDAVAVAQGTLYVASQDGKVYALE